MNASPSHAEPNLPPNQQRSAPLFTVTSPRFSCDGGGGVLGHPKIYLDLTQSGRIDCPYCGRRFALVGAVEE